MLTLLLSGLLCVSPTPAPAASPTGAVVAATIDLVAAPTAAILSAPAEQLSRPVETRTRKLHLVRPDLMHYPSAYDVYC